MRRIGIFTTTRAEFGIFSSLLRETERDKNIEYLLFVGGSHLLSEYGNTIDEIKNEFRITDTFDFFLNEDSSYSLTRSLGIETFELANLFRNYDFDFCCILGDRFELLPIVNTAIVFKKPIIHIHGGEKSEGAIDEQIRHMITKAAHIHFASCEEYAENIRKMGEQEWRIFNVGALGIDNIIHNKRIPKNELFKQLKLDENKKTILLTYHPVTLEFKISPLDQIKNIFNALGRFDFQIVVTTSNVEADRDIIMLYVKEQISKNKDIHYIASLGVIKYYSLIPYCEFVIGNSSSGIVEVPFFHKPTINIGDRQKGRLRHPSIIDTEYSEESIISGINKALSKDFQESIKNMGYKFGDGHAAERIVKILKDIKIDEKLMRKKLDFPE
jgi:UDP-hydrolysing UDP-N-acetyl-D-glucosamine 2-epimerase